MDVITKTYFTVILSLFMFTVFSWIMMNVDEKREDMWFKITVIIVIISVVLIIGGLIGSIWLLPN
jgi:hypothetical protein